jgi:hypothetical protein
MKKMLMLSGLVTVLAACGGTTTVDESTVDTIESTVCSASSSASCGTSCATGYYVSRLNCASSVNGVPCGGDCYASSGTKNIVYCAAVPGGDCGFTACGIGNQLTSAHYITSYSYSSDCDPVWPGNSSTKNQTTYYAIPSPVTTYGFYACGSSCPSGFFAHSTYYSTACVPTTNPAPSSGTHNQTWCQRNP